MSTAHGNQDGILEQTPAAAGAAGAPAAHPAELADQAQSHPTLDDSAVERLRRAFPGLHDTTYLISNSLGAMPRAVEDELLGYARSWRTRGVRAWDEGWWELPVAVGDLVAPFLGVGATQVAMQPNVTSAVALFLSALDYPVARPRIVVHDLEFPSVHYLLEGERRRGAEIALVHSPDGSGIELQDELLRAIDERTRLVVTSHTLFRSAVVLDAAALARRCREVGALLLLDVYQSAGIFPLELERWGVDAAVGGCLKWLCGGPGNAFLWLDPALASSLEPALTGWQSHQRPFAFELGHRRVETGAWRFLTGTPNVSALCAARPGLQLLGALDRDAVRQRSLRLTARLLEAADDAGFASPTPRDPIRRGGTVTVAHPRAELLSERLLAEDILCDYRPGAGVRLSPHVYNTEAECDRAIAALVRHRSEL
jgi:kynureninase